MQLSASPLLPLHAVLLCAFAVKSVGAPRLGEDQVDTRLFCDGSAVEDHAAGRVPRPRLLPVDEGTSDRSFAAFRHGLLNAVARRDAEALIHRASPTIVLGIDGERGPEHFRKLIESEAVDFWGEFGRVLALGGRFDGDTFVAPYVTAAWPSGSLCDGTIVGRGVRLRARPSLTAPVVARLDYELVEHWYSAGDVTIGWTRIRAASGQVGYVSDEFLRSPIDFRAYFHKHNGSWRIAAFLAGD